MAPNQEGLSAAGEPSHALGGEGTTPWYEDHKNAPCLLCREDIDDDVADLGEGLLFGGCEPAKCPYFLERLGVTHVLRVLRRESSWMPPEFEGFEYMTVEVWDLPEDAEKLAAAWEDTFAFITQGKRNQGKVFVHCRAGISRSATVCLAYLMQEKGLSLENAKHMVREVRPQINPNQGFEEQLRKFEQRLREKCQDLNESLDDLNKYRKVLKAKKPTESKQRSLFCCDSYTTNINPFWYSV